MFKIVASLAALALLVAAQNDPSINSPMSVVQCQPVQLSWTATKEPVFISIIPGGQPAAAPLKDFGSQPAGTKSLTWTVDQPAGTDLTFQIKDAEGAIAYSATVPVQDSSDSSCLGAQGSQGSSSNTIAPTTVPGSTAPASSTPLATSAPPSSVAQSAAGSSTRAPATATSARPSSTSAAGASNAAIVHSVEWTGMLGMVATLLGLVTL